VSSFTIKQRSVSSQYPWKLNLPLILSPSLDVFRFIPPNFQMIVMQFRSLILQPDRCSSARY